MARAIIGGGVDRKTIADSAAALGVAVEIEEEEDVEAWPDVWAGAQVFARCVTQWNVGFGGPIGLRYESVDTVMRLMRVPVGDRVSVFDTVRALESEALQIFAERRER